ncbi:hypothetical protein [Oricola cellulosilytica]|uniref:Secreted protein n=1 Tax=Oricola cellulosilytica TaxID=1429082 RepID=A0A4R0PEZ0_9HYPH|nr:hypothetical protein [Oricola cellulosilytica]TCD15139.1 hypothetical protein E0D97_06210 [Oricola cellulosilytica]
MAGNRLFFALCALAVLAIGLLSYAAAAHDAPGTAAHPEGWAYPLACCSGYDCRPVSAAWIQERGGAFVIPTTGELIPYTDTRIKASPDGQYHWCSKYGRDDTDTICLFVSPRSF